MDGGRGTAALLTAARLTDTPGLWPELTAALLTAAALTDTPGLWPELTAGVPMVLLTGTALTAALLTGGAAYGTPWEGAVPVIILLR